MARAERVNQETWTPGVFTKVWAGLRGPSKAGASGGCYFSKEPRERGKGAGTLPGPEGAAAEGGDPQQELGGRDPGTQQGGAGEGRP